MSSVVRWFLIGLVIGVSAAGLLFYGIYLGRTSVEMPEEQLQVDGSDTVSEALRTEETLVPMDHRQSRVELNDLVYTERQNSITEAIRDASPAVVGITVTRLQAYIRRDPRADLFPFYPFLQMPEQRGYQQVQGLGSGFIVSSDGYILTNEHVVNDAAEIAVTTTQGHQYNAEIVGLDYDSDIALLKIDDENLPYLRIAADDEVFVGEWAIAIGNPFGLFNVNDQPSVSVGVVSAVDRDFERNEDNRLYRQMIQTDAAINQGNSGGPLLNVLGEVIGVNTFIFSQGGGGSVGVGFAIPAKRFRSLITELRNRGDLDRDWWAGFEITEIHPYKAAQYGFRGTGVMVGKVYDSGPAATAGLLQDDILMEFNGTPVSNRQEVFEYLNNHDLAVGDTLELLVFRRGQQSIVNLVLEERPK